MQLSLCSLLHSTRTEPYLISLKWVAFLRKTCSQQPCNDTFLARGEMGIVLLFCRDKNFGSPHYPPSALSPHPNGVREAWKLAPWPEMSGCWVQGSHRSCRRQQRSWGCLCEDLPFPLSRQKGWKERAGRAAPLDCSAAGFTPELGGSVARAQRLPHHWRYGHNATKHWSILHSGQTEVTLSIWRRTCQMHLRFHYRLVTSSRKVVKWYVKRHNTAFSA